MYKLFNLYIAYFITDVICVIDLNFGNIVSPSLSSAIKAYLVL